MAPRPTNKVLAKTVQLAVGCDLLASKMSLTANRNISLEVTPLGVMAHSKGTDRTVLVPWPNIKGVELYTVKEPSILNDE